MATTRSIDTASTSDEIIFPEGDLWSDEPPLESNLHLRQIILLIECLEWLWQERQDFFATGNLTIYYSPNQKKSEDFRGPDFFVVLGTQRRLERRSWVVWQEGGRYPNLIVEILSSSTAKVDKGEKKQIYQDIFRTPNYFWFDPESLELAGFRLLEGKYQPIEPTEAGWLWSQELGLYLGVYEGQLRYFTSEGELVPTPEEYAKKVDQKAQLAQKKVRELEQAQLGAISRLNQLGLTLEQIADALSLSVEQVREVLSNPD
jgi:Uma2 family endonuclease